MKAIEKDGFASMGVNLWLFHDPESGKFFDSLTNKDFHLFEK